MLRILLGLAVSCQFDPIQGCEIVTLKVNHSDESDPLPPSKQ